MRRLLILNWLLLAASVPASAADAKNILLITADDLGLQLGCYGETVIETPFLDRLAKQGTRFEIAYVTQASCSPSRSSMFTGLYPHTNGQVGLANKGYPFRMHEQYHDRTLPRLLSDAGYRCAVAGKVHVNPGTALPLEGLKTGNTRNVLGVVKQATAFMQRKSAQPFFLMINWTDPHADGRNKGQRQSFPKQVAGLPEEPVGPEDVSPWPWQQVDTPWVRQRIADYYNSAKRVDIGTGHLLKELDRLGLTENTLVIFVGDHGPPFTRGKTTCYESGLRVPFLIRWPGRKQVPVSSALVSTVDIVPTCVDYAGIEVPDEVSSAWQGKSLRDVISEPGAEWRTYLAGEHHYHGPQLYFPRRAIRDGRYKLIHNPLAGKVQASANIDGDPAPQIVAKQDGPSLTRRLIGRLKNPPEFELYDLQEDPHEIVNLSDKPAHVETLRRMREALHAWQDETDDPARTAEGLEELRDLVNPQ